MTDYSSYSVEELIQELQQKDDAVRMAAEFGQQILLQLQDAQQKIATVTNENDELKIQLFSLNGQVENLTATNENLEKKLEDLAKKPAQELGRSEDEYSTILSKYKMLKEQMEDAATENRNLVEELKQKELQLEKAKSQKRDLTELKETNIALSSQLETVKAELEEITEREKDHKRQLLIQKEAARKAEEQQEELESKFQSTEFEFMKFDKTARSQLTELHTQRQQLQAALQKKKEKIQLLKQEFQSREQVVAQMALEIQSTSAAYDKLKEFLEEKMGVIDSLRNRDQDSSLGSSLEGKEDENEHSLLDDLLSEISNKISTTPSAPKVKATEENCEEYFFLASTAIKIQLAIKMPHTSDGCNRINIKALYDQCRKANVPFHEWYDWIRAKLIGKQQSLPSSATLSEDDPNNKIEGLELIESGSGIVRPRPAGPAATSPSRPVTTESSAPPKKTGFSFFSRKT